MSNINVNNITPLAGTSGTVNVSGSLFVSGSITANGNIILGDSTSDSVSLGAEISSSIIPDANATYNLGSNAKKWNKVHAVTGSFLHISGATNFSSNVTVTGSLTVSGSSTLTNFGNFRNRFPQDNRAFEVSTDPTVAGGFREGLATPDTGSAPHLHFMLSGSGHTGIGLLNPSHTLHVSTSDGGFSKVALYVDGKSYFGSTISSSLMPDAGGTYNLGSMAQSWKSLHVHGIGHIHTASINVVSSSLTPNATNVYDIGSVTKQWRSGSFGHISSSTISASNNVGIGRDLSVGGSTILGNQLTNDTHLITGKNISLVGPVTASGTFRNDGTTFDVNSSGMVSLTSTLNSANSIYLHANGGTSETIKLHSDQSTSVRSIGLVSDAGGIELDMNASSKKIALLSSGAVDINAATGIEIDSVGAAMTLTVTADGAGEDLTIRQNGSQNASVFIQSAGTGADAIKIQSTAASIDIDSADNITIDAADDISLTSTSADGLISLVSAHTAGDALHIDANANVGSIVNIDAGILDIDSDGATTINAASTVSVIGATSATFGDDTEALIYDGSGNLDLDAVALDVDTSGAITIDTAGAASHIAITTAHTAGDAFHLDANANAGSIVKIDAGILDLNVTAGATLDAVGVAIGAGSGELDLTTTGTMDINSAALDIDASGAINIAAAGGASDISISTAHTAGVAFHLDANANAGSIVDIDAGILDVNVTGVADITAGGVLGLSTTGATSDITIKSGHGAGVALHIDCDTAVGSIIDIDAGILDIDVSAAVTIDAVGVAINAGEGEMDLTTSAVLDINSAAFDVDTTGAVTFDAQGAASDFKFTTAHTAGNAFHIDANTHAASAVVIDAGILDINVTGASTIDTTALTISSLVDLTPTLETKTANFTAAVKREYIVNKADGAAIVLPSAIAGARITILIGTLITSNTTTITAASGDLIKGYAFLEATDAANNKTMFIPDASDDLIITLNGGTRGGLVGDRIELVGISATEWRVRATLSHTGTAATPFS